MANDRAGVCGWVFMRLFVQQMDPKMSAQVAEMNLRELAQTQCVNRGCASPKIPLGRATYLSTLRGCELELAQTCARELYEQA